MSSLRYYSYITINFVVYAGHLKLIGERKLEITVGQTLDHLGRQNTSLDGKSLGKRKIVKSWDSEDNTKMKVQQIVYNRKMEPVIVTFALADFLYSMLKLRVSLKGSQLIGHAFTEFGIFCVCNMCLIYRCCQQLLLQTMDLGIVKREITKLRQCKLCVQHSVAITNESQELECRSFY